MKKTLIKTVTFGCIFASGYIVGEVVTGVRYTKKTKKIQPLFVSMCTNLMHAMVQNDMTPEELDAYCDEQLAFFDVVIKEQIK